MKPITRLENFLAKIAKDPDAKDLTPKTRKEYYLNEIAQNGGSGSGSYVIHATLTPHGDLTPVIEEQSIETVGDGPALGAITAFTNFDDDDAPESMTITFNGTVYENVQKTGQSGEWYYGDDSFSNYPFLLGFETSGGETVCSLLTETAGTYTIKAEAVTVVEGEYDVTADKTLEEIYEAYSGGAVPVLDATTADGNSHALASCTMASEDLFVFYCDYWGDGDWVAAFALDSDGWYCEISESWHNIVPSVSSSDNGKVLQVVDGEWAASDKEFVVTFTPTAEDLSGTMDKTPAEIKAAYLAGKEIVAKVSQDGTDTILRPYAYAAFGSHVSVKYQFVYILNDAAVLVVAHTAISGSGIYTTNIYHITPAT